MTLHLIPQLSGDAWVILTALFLIVFLVACLMAWAEHVATKWQADQYEAGQPASEGKLTRRTLQPRIPTQRDPGDES